MRTRWSTAGITAALLPVAAASALAQQVHLSPVLSGLLNPVFVCHAGDGSNRLFVVEQRGAITVLQPGELSPTVFLDITSKVVFSGERGLLGLAFHPQYLSNGRFFAYYTRAGDGAIVVAEYRASPPSSNQADPTETVLLTIPHPTYANHNGGMLAFGPDGYLYIGVGDGGGSNDPLNNAQNTNTLLGKILRIDIDAPGGTYASLTDNPFYGATPGRDEIFAYGMRNPWRFSFDRRTGHQWVGDVGQGAREEVDTPIVNGGNYGWRVFEGLRCTNNDPVLCASPDDYLFPVFDYQHSGGRCSITAGYAYRGPLGLLPSGTYVYGDHCSGEIFTWNGSTQSVLVDTTARISSFGEDEQGELYVVDLGGTVSRLVESPPSVTALTPDVAFPSPAGTLVTWTASVSGGTGPYTYQFWLFNGSTWTEGRGWDPSHRWTWNPLLPGTYSVQVWVRDVGSTTAFDAWGQATAWISTPVGLTVTALTPSPTSAAAGEPVRWSATAAGGTRPYTYRFWVHDGAQWRVGQDWSASASWTWTPPAAGTYRFQVWARNADSTAVYDAWRAAHPYTAARPGTLTVTALTSEALTVPMPAGTPLHWAATLAGGTPPYTYKFWVYNGSSWSVPCDWTSNSECEWVAPSAGAYTLQVWARNAGSSAAHDAWKGTTFAVGSGTPLRILRIVADRTFPVSAGTAVRWTATATGGLGPYTYKFWVYNGSSWSVPCDWTRNSQCEWVAPSPGTYTLQVWARNAGSPAPYDAWRAAGPASITGAAPLTVEAFSIAPGAPLVTGGPALLTATATGGLGPYEYQFWVYDGVGWSVGQSWGTTNTYRWTPSGPGSYTFQVWVRNAGSLAAWDAWRAATTSVQP